MTRSNMDRNAIVVRNILIKDLHKRGATHAFIGKVFGITSARVCQILGEKRRAA